MSATAEAPAEVKAPKVKRPRLPIVYDSVEECTKASDHLRSLNHNGGSNVYEVRCDKTGKTVFVLGGSERDALGKLAEHNKTYIKRLDAPSKPKKEKMVIKTADDLLAVMGSLSAEDRARVMAALGGAPSAPAN